MTARLKLQWRRLLVYLLDRGQETSTWTGLILVLTASGSAIRQEDAPAITAGGIFIVGAIRMLLPNTLGGKDGAQ